MIEELKNGIKHLDDFVFQFAQKQHIDLEDLIFDGGIIRLNSEPHLLEIRCCGKKVHVNLSNHEIINGSVGTKHKLVMALMTFLPMSPCSNSPHCAADTRSQPGT